ncbi:MAG: Gx transporter family protein [Clostridia bacterium]|nr:Gx transporter family protein [Clostridia bacterium]
MAKKIAYCSLLTALALIFGFIEHLVSFDYIAPGVKLGLANSIVLLLIFVKQYKSAIAVNLARILLSTLLFSGPMAAIFAISGAALSMIVSVLLLKSKHLSIIGISIGAAACHNIGQILVAGFVMGTWSVLYYMPVLVFCGAISGLLTGTAANLVYKRIKKR